MSEPDVDDVDDEMDDDLDDDLDDEEAEDEAGQVPAPTARAVLEYLARAVVDDPDAVVIQPVDGRRGLTLQVHVGPGDMGRVIGKRGRVATSIRTIVRAAAVRDGVDVDVDFVD